MKSNNFPTIYFYAPNVFTGGGKSLLFQIIYHTKKLKINNFYFILDKRLEKEIDTNSENIFFCKKGFFSRIKCEFYFMKKSNKEDTIIIFNNVAPIFSSKAKVIMYLQHILFSGRYTPTKYSNKYKQQIFYSVYYMINKLFYFRIKKIFVQSKSMKDNLNIYFPQKNIEIFPFISEIFFENNVKIEKRFDFIYPANNYFHKNHINLLKAIVLLKKENIRPSFIFTISRGDNDLEKIILKYKNNFDLNISLQNEVLPDDMKKLYLKCQAMIFPSKFESFGMPLVEAKKLNLKVIAPELDYVRDIIDPDFTFNTESPISISRAIKRYLNIEENETKIYTAKDFINKMTNF